MKRYLFLIPIVLSAILFFFGHAGAQADAEHGQPPTYKDFVNSHAFPYAAPGERLTELKKAYPRLTAGLPQSRVREIMGEPDYAESLFSKAKEPGFLGTAWTYVIEKANPGLTNLKTDIAIQIYFDRDGKTAWINSTVEGLTPIGNPSTIGGPPENPK